MAHVVFHLHMLMFEQPNYVPEHLALFRLFALLLNVNFSLNMSTYLKRHVAWNLPGFANGYFTAGSSCDPGLNFKTVDSRELHVIRGLVYDRILAISDFLGDSPYYNPFQCLFLAIGEIKDVANSCTPPVDLETQVRVRI